MFTFWPIPLFILLMFTSRGGVRGGEISNNDQFRAIALTVTKPPVCCLKTSTPLEPIDDEVLLSFEEWKQKQQETQRVFKDGSDENNRSLVTENRVSDEADNHKVATVPDSNNTSAEDVSGGLQSYVAPHFRVPITDRFNYANEDCSARVHTSHKSAKSPSAILSSKKDRYMLSPCKSTRENQFVVVELCDDIRIDTVQLANFEFFSGVFKDFSVSVAKTYSIDPEGWTLSGTYTAKNVRGVQSFHLPTSLRDFYRFIRIDFLSYYGNEYYCPVSILRVYGLSHLEEWKWDVWQAESRAKLQRGVLPAAVSVLKESPTLSTGTTNIQASFPDAEPTTTIPVLSQEPERILTTTTLFDSLPSTTQTEPEVHGTETTSETNLVFQSSVVPQDPAQMQNSSESTDFTPLSTSISHTSVPASVLQARESILSSDIHQDRHVPSVNVSVTPTLSTIPSSHATPSNTPPSVPTGESIYRTIMNRLTTVENNQTLYMKYVEQQNGAVRDMIRRLGEDVGRLEGITRAQGLTLQRAVNDWENQRYQLQMEYKDILGRMEVLSREIIIEKRLGVAQLCLLLAVLIFLGLTRGSRGNEAFGKRRVLPRDTKAREWRRHRSWTGDKDTLGKKSDFHGWKGVGNPSRDVPSENTITKAFVKRPNPLVLRPINDDAEDVNAKLPFPFSDPRPHSAIGNTTNRPRRRTVSHSSSRESSGAITPSYSPPIVEKGQGTNRRIAFQRPVTPTSRSNFVFRTPQNVHRSHSSIGSVAGRSVKSATPLIPLSQTLSWGGVQIPRSAKNWARTAHLHDVRSVKIKQEKTERTATDSADTDIDDVFLDTKSSRSSAVPSRRKVGAITNEENILLGDGHSSLGCTEGNNFVEDGSEPTESVVNPSAADESDLWIDTDSPSADHGYIG